MRARRVHCTIRADFGTVGFGIAFGARKGAANLKHQAALQATAPDQPWRWRPEWNAGPIATLAGKHATGRRIRESRSI
jgi:hypothetical protein